MNQPQTNRPRYTFTMNAALPPLQPYTRCPCGTCAECRSNARWDRIFAKFEAKNYGEERGIFRSTLQDI
jgi:hypothetical protein